MDDIRAAAGATISGIAITRKVQLAGTREVDLNGAITVDVGIAGA